MFGPNRKCASKCGSLNTPNKWSKKVISPHQHTDRCAGQAEAGTPLLDFCPTHGVGTAGFCSLRAKFGGMDASLMKKIKEPEDEKRHAKKIYIDAQMLALIVEESLVEK